MKTCMEAYVFEGLLNCMVDRNATPHIAVRCFQLDESREFHVPTDYIDQGTITLNISVTAIANFYIDKEKGYITFNAKFKGINHSIIIPIECVIQLFDPTEKIPLGMPQSYTIMPDLIQKAVPKKPDVQKPETTRTSKVSHLKVIK